MNEMGRRYICKECGAEVLCTRPGSGQFQCCDKDMTEQKPKPLPSAD